jgi:osmotically-inducible protein OsmY
MMFTSSRKYTGWLLAWALLTGSGCSNEDADHLVRVGKVTAAKVEALTGGNDKLLGGWQAVRSDLNEVGLDARVGIRLRWDKSLADVRIEVHAKDGQVELKGVVNDLAQRRRAVDLAESTAGAEKVNDLLEIKTP